MVVSADSHLDRILSEINLHPSCTKTLIHGGRENLTALSVRLSRHLHQTMTERRQRNSANNAKRKRNSESSRPRRNENRKRRRGRNRRKSARRPRASLRLRPGMTPSLVRIHQRLRLRLSTGKSRGETTPSSHGIRIQSSLECSRWWLRHQSTMSLLVPV